MRVAVVIGLCSLLLGSCSKSEPVAEAVVGTKAKADEPVKKYELRGEVKRIDAQAHLAAIRHDAIGDWMGAMTMEFPVKNDADFAKLTPGHQVRATVYVQGFSYWVADVQPTPAPAPTPAK